MENGRRDRDAEWAGPIPMCGGYKLGKISWSEGSQPHTRPSSTGFQCQEYVFIFSGFKNQRELRP